MLTKFWEVIGNKLADRWAAISVPSLVFWLGGLLSWAYSRGGFSAFRAPSDSMGHQPVPTQIALLLLALLGVASTAVIVQLLTIPVQRLLEGYWPLFLDPLRKRLVRRVMRRINSDVADWGNLIPRVSAGTADSRDLILYARLDQRIRRFPSNPSACMPTNIGNVMRAAQSRPYDKYGLDAATVWPRLLLLLPATTRQEFEGAQIALSASVATLIYSLGFFGFAVFTPLAIPIALGFVAISSFLLIPSRAKTVADLLETVFDLHRSILYK
jgi:hypothetical protein